MGAKMRIRMGSLSLLAAMASIMAFVWLVVWSGQHHPVLPAHLPALLGIALIQLVCSTPAAAIVFGLKGAELIARGINPG